MSALSAQSVLGGSFATERAVGGRKPRKFRKPGEHQGLLLERRQTSMAEEQASGREKILLARTAEGDQEAFETLFRRFERSLYTYFLRMLQDRPTAEDLVCETMTAVWRGARGFRGESQVSTWIFGIAHKMAASVLRRRRPQVSLEEVDAAPSRDGPEEAGERADVAAKIRRALATLSAAHREVIELTFYREFSYPEIARILGVPVNTVKTRMFYARQKLKIALQEVGVSDVA